MNLFDSTAEFLPAGFLKLTGESLPSIRTSSLIM